jgi:hypothetical protein
MISRRNSPMALIAKLLLSGQTTGALIGSISAHLPCER